MRSLTIFVFIAICFVAFAAQAADLEITEITPETYLVVEMSAILEDSEKIFMDRDYTITTVPDEVLAEIEDKEAYWIKTGNGNKHNADEVHISFETNSNVWVYICYDRRAANPPAWVTDSYEDLEVDFGTSDVPFGIWKSMEEVPAGTVQIPGNDFGGAAGASSNYQAFVVMGSLAPVNAAGKLPAVWGSLKSE